MNERLKQIIKRVILGAAASLSAAGLSSVAKDNEIKNTPSPKQTELVTYNFTKENDIPKLVLKKPSKLSAIGNFFHRSHSSHASHASHASHVSGYSQPSNRNTQPKQSTRPNSEENTNESPKKQNNTKNNLMYELGSRVLEKGMKGTDVVEIQEMLTKRGYPVKADGDFEESTEDAVKQFQKNSEIDTTGKVDITTLYYLKKK